MQPIDAGFTSVAVVSLYTARNIILHILALLTSAEETCVVTRTSTFFRPGFHVFRQRERLFESRSTRVGVDRYGCPLVPRSVHANCDAGDEESRVPKMNTGLSLHLRPVEVAVAVAAAA